MLSAIISSSHCIIRNLIRYYLPVMGLLNLLDRTIVLPTRRSVMFNAYKVLTPLLPVIFWNFTNLPSVPYKLHKLDKNLMSCFKLTSTNAPTLFYLFPLSIALMSTWKYSLSPTGFLKILYLHRYKIWCWIWEVLPATVFIRLFYSVLASADSA